jgi:cytochrome d ubiquinol oxidase subunit I
VHLASIWLTAVGTSLSAFFILAANSWMQHPVGYRVDPATHRVVLTSIVALLTNPTVLATWPHVFFAAFMVAGAVLVAASAWHVARKSQLEVFQKALRLGLVVTLLAGIGAAVTGDVQARMMESQQPMKMASAEALYSTTADASFSLFTIGSLNGSKEVWSVRVPYLLSLISTLNPHGTVQGINNVERAYAARYGPGQYKPVIPVTYWSFRFMIGFGSLAALLAAFGLWLTRRQRIPRSRWFYRVALWGLPLPYLGIAFGWIFTEMGRQPWTVFGLLTTANSVSPGVTLSSVILSLTVFTLLYAALAGIAWWLTVRHVKAGAPAEAEQPGAPEPLPVFQY